MSGYSIQAILLFAISLMFMSDLVRSNKDEHSDDFYRHYVAMVAMFGILTTFIYFDFVFAFYSFFIDSLMLVSLQMSSAI